MLVSFFFFRIFSIKVTLSSARETSSYFNDCSESLSLKSRLCIKLLCSVVVFLTVTTKAYLTFDKSVCVTKNCNTWLHKQDVSCSTSRVFTHKFKLQATFTAVQRWKCEIWITSHQITTRLIQLLQPCGKFHVMRKKTIAIFEAGGTELQ